VAGATAEKAFGFAHRIRGEEVTSSICGAAAITLATAAPRPITVNILLL
jgi:hypothetical protein